MLEDTKDVGPCLRLISAEGLGGPTSILTSSKPIFPEILFVFLATQRQILTDYVVCSL